MINKENIKWLPKWKITKYNKGETTPYEVKDIVGNALTAAGMNEIWKLVCGDTVDDFGTAPVLIVGTGTGAETEADNEATFTAGVKQGMEGGYPTFGTNKKATWRASFDGDTANQAWQEFGLLSKETGGVLMNRKTSDQGSKTLGQVWDLELMIELSNTE